MQKYRILPILKLFANDLPITNDNYIIKIFLIFVANYKC